MKLLKIALIFMLCAAIYAEDTDEEVNTSRELVQTFSMQLKTALITSIQNDGILDAIKVCSVKAPQIATEISKDTNWMVRRTSLKTRNPENSPDAWEQNTLLEFENKKEVGVNISSLEHYEVIQTKDGELFRYMKAIPTGGVCLTCHGEAVSPEINEKIKTIYPQDQATGFKLNDIRGAFSIEFPM